MAEKSQVYPIAFLAGSGQTGASNVQEDNEKAAKVSKKCEVIIKFLQSYEHCMIT